MSTTSPAADASEAGAARTDSSSSLLVEVVPVAAAIGTFGVIYGATATAVIGPDLTIASSVLMFSGAAQFTMVGLVAAGAAPAAVLLAVAVLGLRHVPLAAVLRTRLAGSRARRGLLALVLIDEAVGLAVAARRPAARTMVVVGISAYGAFLVGTVAGVLGADLVAAAPLASVVFVILFVGLAALTCRSAADAGRAAVAGAAAGGLLVAFPAAGALGAILVAAACAALLRARDRTPRARVAGGRP